MNEQRITYLVRQYQQQATSTAEQQELLELVLRDDLRGVFETVLLQELEGHETGEAFLQEDNTGRIRAILAMDKPGMMNGESAGAKMVDFDSAHLGNTPAPVGEGRDEASIISSPSIGGGRGEAGVGTRKSFPLYRWMAAAAAIIALGLGAWYFIQTQKEKPKTDLVVHEAGDVKAPATNRAMITLSNGRNVYLDSAANGTLASQGNINLVKTGNGVITYSPTAGGASSSSTGKAELRYNTLSNPRGSQPITLTLSDGTQVWLNAESSLKYPVAFIGNERKVEITGEAYFEIAHNALKPFRVLLPSLGGVGGGLVEVLGTHFNINAYANESSFKTTLLEGSVRVYEPKYSTRNPKQKSQVIKPGQQVRLSNAATTHTPGVVQEDWSSFAVQNNVDVDAVVAWKNGFFSLKNQDFPSVMKQLERWYDITVKYEGSIPNVKFQGEMDRGVNLSDFVKYMVDLHINARIEGRVLIIAGK
jgi:transmembrane sensor